MLNSQVGFAEDQLLELFFNQPQVTTYKSAKQADCNKSAAHT
jgi:hypothetical protein